MEKRTNLENYNEAVSTIKKYEDVCRILVAVYKMLADGEHFTRN